MKSITTIYQANSQMEFQNFVLLIVATATCTTVEQSFPLALDDDCFINLVGKGVDTKSVTRFLDLKDSAYTFSTFEYFNISDDEEIRTDDTNLTLKESYFRYDQKLRGSCIIFLLRTLSFNETVTAIYKSGFATSDEILFFVQFPSLIEWKDHLLKFSALDQHSPFIFHANIVFLTNDSEKIGIHCYFCFPNPTRLHLINTNSIKSYIYVKRIAQALNGNGHGRHALVQSAMGGLGTDDCFNTHRDLIYQTRQNFYQHLRKHCSPPFIVIYLVIQPALNISCITKESDVPDDELDDLEWFLHLRYGEATAQQIPNEITATRGSILIMENYKVKLLSCVTTRSISQKVDYVFITVFNWLVWGALLIASVSYVMLYNNLHLGLDTIWHLFSHPCWQTHPRKLICVPWICMIFLSCIYQSSISSESVQPQEFPSLSTLVKRGYKLWLPKKQYFSRLQRKNDKEVVVKIVGTGAGIDKLQGKNLEEMFNTTIELLYDGNGSHSVHYPEYHNLSKLIHSLTSHKLVLGEPGAASVFGQAAFTEGLIHFQKTKLCKFFDINDLSFIMTLRLWSYLSYRSSSLLRRFTEMGIPTRFVKLQIDIKHNSVREVVVAATGTCVPPRPIELKSAIVTSMFDEGTSHRKRARMEYFATKRISAKVAVLRAYAIQPIQCVFDALIIVDFET
ncbi:unnamed protein product [Orchesella dallaii]|uniref:Uncharacterized protein n=1 Tax=Orchesella dallaii TaxID=48710 RepID=A0ABP1S4M6_9HEXA